MTLQSMTAFGSATFQTSECSVGCEIKTLNSRFLEVSVKLPKYLISLETEVIAKTKESLSRGRVDIFFDIKPTDANKYLPKLDEATLEYYTKLINKSQTIIQEYSDSSIFSLAYPSVVDILNLDGVLQYSDRTTGETRISDIYKEGVFTSLHAALEEIRKVRETEGLALRSYLKKIIQEIETERTAISNKVPEIRQQINSNYLKRLEALLTMANEKANKAVSELPEDRLLLEIGILLEKSDIEEELSRLLVHITEFNNQLDAAKAVGRRLDFLCQEMYREINTISNKLVQIEVSEHILNLKEAVERLRQQVQNIE